MDPSRSIFSPFSQKLVLLLWLSLTVWLIYGMLFERYPAAYLIEWQVQLFNGYYYPKVTGLILIVGAGLVSFPVGLTLDFITRKGLFRPKPTE